MITPLRHLIILCLCCQSFAAPDPEKKPSDNQQLIDTLFSSRDSDEFHAAIEKAKKAGISEQATLEARFLYYVDKQDEKALADLSRELVPLYDKFDASNSEAFALKEDWQAIIQYTQALAALQAGKRDDFKKHITEAFWLSPRQASSFAPYIDKLRLDEAMRTVTIPADLTLPSILAEHPNFKFEEANKDHSAILLHFWSPWSQEIELTLEDLASTTKEAKKHKIAVVSVLAERSGEVEEDALRFIRESADHIPCFWVKDHTTTPLSQLLRVQNVPTMALIDSKGKVLFNGHPSDPALWNTLKKVAPDFKKPDAPKPTTEPNPEPSPEPTPEP